MDDIIERFSDVKVLVFGDLMLDLYLSGRVDRVSPEAPVPILKVDGERAVPGGAANVAANVIGLGAKAFVSGIVGTDHFGRDLSASLQTLGADSSGVIVSENRPTTVKTRLIAQHHQLGRFDREVASSLDSAERESLWMALEPLIEECDVVLVSDYGKGVVDEELIVRLITKSNDLERPVIVDPKGLDFSKYRNSTLLTPNEREALESAEFFGHKGRDINSSGRFLLDRFSLKTLLVTLGERGMVLFREDADAVEIAADERNVFDVTGAGDTVISTLAVALAAGASLDAAARMANYAAGVVVEHLGTTAITAAALNHWKGS